MNKKEFQHADLHTETGEVSEYRKFINSLTEFRRLPNRNNGRSSFRFRMNGVNCIDDCYLSLNGLKRFNHKMGSATRTYTKWCTNFILMISGILRSLFVFQFIAIILVSAWHNCK